MNRLLMLKHRRLVIMTKNIVKLTLSDEAQSANVEVRNWLDSVEDKMSGIMHKPKMRRFLSQRMSWWGLYNNYDFPKDLNDEAMERLIRELT